MKKNLKLFIYVIETDENNENIIEDFILFFFIIPAGNTGC